MCRYLTRAVTLLRLNHHRFWVLLKLKNLATCQENQETQLLSHRSQPMTPMLRAVLVSQQLQLDQSNQSGSDSQLQHWRDAPRSARPREGWNRDHSFSHPHFISVVWSPWVILCCNSLVARLGVALFGRLSFYPLALGEVFGANRPLWCRQLFEKPKYTDLPQSLQ